LALKHIIESIVDIPQFFIYNVEMNDTRQQIERRRPQTIIEVPRNQPLREVDRRQAIYVQEVNEDELRRLESMEEDNRLSLWFVVLCTLAFLFILFGHILVITRFLSIGHPIGAALGTMTFSFVVWFFFVIAVLRRKVSIFIGVS
jgi:hypothetical protein